MLKIVLLFIVSVSASGLTSYFYKRLTNDSTHRSYSVLTSAAWMFPVSLIFFIVSSVSGGFKPTLNLTAAALLTGGAAAAATYMLLESLRKGSYTTAIIIINMNFYIPILFSRLFLGEKATPLQLAGILLATVVIVLINIGAKSAYRPKDSLSGIIAACFACLANGTVNFGIKFQQYMTPGEGQNTFFCLTYFFSAAISVILFFILREKKAKPSEQVVSVSRLKKYFIPALGLGICMTLCYYPQSLLAAIPGINAAAQFTVTVTGSLILSLVIGWIHFNEKITCAGIISLMLGLLAVVFQWLSY